MSDDAGLDDFRDAPKSEQPPTVGEILSRVYHGDLPVSEAEALLDLRQSPQAEPDARAVERFEFVPVDDFLVHTYYESDPLWGISGDVLLAPGVLLMVYGSDGSGKTTWTLDGLAHLAAGIEWLGVPVLRPVRFVVIENEGPPSLFQKKLERKIATWTGPKFSQNVFVLREPWGSFSFADDAAKAALVSFCSENEIDVITANPTLGLGVAGSGTPDETAEFVEWLKECGLTRDRAFWLLHHENARGQISGDWGRHADTKVFLRRDGDALKTLLDWQKTRHASVPSELIPKKLVLEWIVETQGYSVATVSKKPTVDAEEAREHVLKVLRETDEWRSTTSIRDASGLRATVVDQALRDLFEAGLARLWIGRKSSGAEFGPEEVVPSQWDDWGRLRTPKRWKRRNGAEKQSSLDLGTTSDDFAAPTPEEGGSRPVVPPYVVGGTDGDDFRPGSSGDVDENPFADEPIDDEPEPV